MFRLRGSKHIPSSPLFFLTTTMDDTHVFGVVTLVRTLAVPRFSSSYCIHCLSGTATLCWASLIGTALYHILKWYEPLSSPFFYKKTSLNSINYVDVPFVL